MTNERKKCSGFTNDWEKMYDFWNMTKEEFLESYSYLTQEEYDITCMETIGLHICGHEIPRRVTWIDFEEAIETQLNNFREKKKQLTSEQIYEEAYTIAKHEAIAAFFMNNIELDCYFLKLVPHLDNLLEDFCLYEWNCDKAAWTDWDELLKVVEEYIADKEGENNNNKEDN